MVRLDRALVTESLAKAPRELTLYAKDPQRHMPVHGRHVVFAPTSGPPNITDTTRGKRPGSYADFANILKLCQSYEVIHILGGGVEPQDIPVHVRHLETTRAMLLMTDKIPKVYARGPGQNADNFELIRIAYGLTREEFESRPYTCTIINTNSPLQLDIPMANGIMDYAAAGQVPDHHAVYARGRHGAGDDCRRAHPGARRSARGHYAGADRPRRSARDLWQLHLQCRHEVRFAGLRHARIRESDLRRRSARASHRFAVALLERQRLECSRTHRPATNRR